jgi:hypothetical protein
MNELRGPIVAAALASVMLMAPRARADGGEAAAAAPAETAPWSGLHFDVEAAGGAVVIMTSVPARGALQVPSSSKPESSHPAPRSCPSWAASRTASDPR